MLLLQLSLASHVFIKFQPRNLLSICITVGTTGWIKQIGEILDIGIGKNGLWIVRTDNRICYRDHSYSTLVAEISSTGWQLVNGKLFY